MTIKQKIEFEVNNPKSRITFEKTGGGSWSVWDRFIAIDQKKLYHIGNICGTCSYFFRKQEANISINFNQDILIDALNNGKLSFESGEIAKLAKLIPNGKYAVIETEIQPQLVSLTSGNNYFVNEQREAWAYEVVKIPEDNTLPFNHYYREPLVDFGKIMKDDEHKHGFFNFFIPLYPIDQLNKERIEHYKQAMNEGKQPIVISLGVLDVKTSMEYPEINGEEIDPEFPTHWCLANYIIDGHHKIMAASQLNQAIKLITFVSREESWKLIDEMIGAVKDLT